MLLRVAAYCRVSTGDESQQTSYTNQKAFYTRYINENPRWQVADIYADEAISGTSRAHRKEFNRMMEDALTGKIDYIVTKSISRFARNTVDTLNCVRQLRQMCPPVGIYFEKENINTLDAAGELILTILSALAQDESRSISENIRWTFQKNFQMGKPQINLKRMLGYEKGKNGEWMIDETQAKAVRFLFRRYVCGYSANAVAKQANEAGYRTVNGKNWTAGAVLDILRNEKYVGDLEMQKTVTVDFLTHRSVKNNGEAPKYYVRDHHAGIIDRQTWEKVQMILKSNSRNRGKTATGKKKGEKNMPFFQLICGEKIHGKICGERYFRLTYSAVARGYRDERSDDLDAEQYLEKYLYAYPVWRCRGKSGKRKIEKGDGQEVCPSKVLWECALEQSFMEMLYWLKWDWEEKGKKSWLAAAFREIYEKCFRMDKNQAGHQKEKYDIFLKCLAELPKVNAAGMRLNVNGLNVQGTLFRSLDGRAIPGKRSAVNSGRIRITPEKIAEAPDFLPFERGIYAAFMEYGCVRGDEVEYMTNFGVRLRSFGNSRTLGSFLGYRRCREDGTIEFLDTPWKVNGKKIQYRRKERARDK